MTHKTLTTVTFHGQVTNLPHDGVGHERVEPLWKGSIYEILEVTSNSGRAGGGSRARLRHGIGLATIRCGIECR